MEPGITGYVETGGGRRLSFNLANDRLYEHYSGAEEPEDAVEFLGFVIEAEFENDGELMADGGPELVWVAEHCGIKYLFGSEEEPEVECIGVDCGEELSFEQVPDDRNVEIITDGGWDIPEVGGAGHSFAGPGDDLRRCPECCTINNIFVNDIRCYSCGFRWGSGGKVLDDDGDDDGAEILTDGGRPVREHEEHRT
jgi:hypothetical protein